MDECDRASLYEEQDLDRAMLNHRLKTARNTKTLTGDPRFCEECEELIPLARVKSVNAILCIDCQIFAEKLGEA
jgi:RNA polymerase-binding transcription factor DksA